MKKLSILAAAALMASSAIAQKGVEDGSQYGHGEDSVRCIMNVVLYSDAVKIKDYANAFNPWQIVFNECPKAKKTTLYSDGVKIIKALYPKADAAKQSEYYDLLIKVYDQRIKYYGTNKNYPTSYLQGMKGLDMLSLREGVETSEKAFALLGESLKGQPHTIQPAFAQKYLLCAVDLFNNGKMSNEQVIDAYIEATRALGTIKYNEKDPKKQQSKEETLADAKAQVEQIFAQSGAADCETIAKIFAPALDANRENADWLKRVNKLLGKGDCTENDLFYATSECLHKIDPQASSARGVARMYLKQNDVEKAIEYYKEAVALETESMEDKAKYSYELATAYFSAERLADAKAAALEAAKLREGWGDPYLLIGKIYASGASKIGEKDYERKAGFWAAVDKFVRAKNVDSSEKVQNEANELIRQYSQYFPDKETLFFEGIQDGTSYHVGGFINENTTVRAKK